jgi:hypothetical protein
MGNGGYSMGNQAHLRLRMADGRRTERLCFRTCRSVAVCTWHPCRNVRCRTVDEFWSSRPGDTQGFSVRDLFLLQIMTKRRAEITATPPIAPPIIGPSGTLGSLDYNVFRYRFRQHVSGFRKLTGRKNWKRKALADWKGGK